MTPGYNPSVIWLNKNALFWNVLSNEGARRNLRFFLQPWLSTLAENIRLCKLQSSLADAIELARDTKLQIC